MTDWHEMLKLSEEKYHLMSEKPLEALSRPELITLRKKALETPKRQRGFEWSTKQLRVEKLLKKLSPQNPYN